MENVSLMTQSSIRGKEVVNTEERPSLDNSDALMGELFLQNLALAGQALEENEGAESTLSQQEEKNTRILELKNQAQDSLVMGRNPQFQEEQVASLKTNRVANSNIEQQEALKLLGRRSSVALPINRLKMQDNWKPSLAATSFAMATHKASLKDGLQQYRDQLGEQQPFPSILSKDRTYEMKSSPPHSIPAQRLEKELMGGGELPTTASGATSTTDQMVNTRTLVATTTEVAMDDVNPLHSVGTGQLIEKITHYIGQRAVGNMREIDLNVNHGELGNFKIQVAQDSAQQGVELTITVFTREGADFFVPNQSKILSSLAGRGIQVQDFKLEQQFSNEQDHGSLSREDSQSKNSQQHQDSQRRRELWRELTEGVV